MCLETGRMTLIVARNTGVVDHKRPIAHGGDMWSPSNHWGLCNAHHSGLKARLERYALDTNQMDQIQLWCDDPASRPKFRGDLA